MAGLGSNVASSALLNDSSLNRSPTATTAFHAAAQAERLNDSRSVARTSRTNAAKAHEKEVVSQIEAEAEQLGLRSKLLAMYAAADERAIEAGLPIDFADALAAELASTFAHLPRVELVRTSNLSRLELTFPATALVTPANTACCMGGGFDAAIAARLGWVAGPPDSRELNPLQRSLLSGTGTRAEGAENGAPALLPVGSAVAVPLALDDSSMAGALAQEGASSWSGVRWLIAAPTMALPAQPLPSPAPVHAAIRAAMTEARRVRAEHIVCPSFGTGWGGLSPREASEAMLGGFCEAWASPTTPS
jgi:O-acetyl-ADP-ribose deacetylase (regulator of RNase III)